MNYKIENDYKLNNDQKNFIKDTIITSFPQIKLKIEKNYIKITNLKKKDI